MFTTATMAGCTTSPVKSSTETVVRARFGRLAAFIVAALLRMREGHRRRKAVEELMALGHRDLRDIGLTRESILSAVYADQEGSDAIRRGASL